ncbi:MAG: flagellar export protein FliJ [Lachnospiraceae bacterium]|nr:flagellar export protein FliJ [Lachnospiraceae bacterium]
MAKFFYKMQNILDIKEKLETQARNEYAVANSVLAEEEEKLNSLELRRQQYEARLKELYTGMLDMKEIEYVSEAVEMMKYYKQQQEVNVRKARKQVDIARDRLQEAMQERKTHEKLKENAFEQFKIDVATAESKEVDELTSYRFGS